MSWILVWVTYDATKRPYYCGHAPGEDGHDEHVWTDRIDDAFRFESREAIEECAEFSDYFDSEDVEVRRIQEAP